MVLIVALGDVMMIVVSLDGHRMNVADGGGINKVDVNLVSVRNWENRWCDAIAWKRMLMLTRDDKKVMAAKVVADGDAMMIVVKGTAVVMVGGTYGI